MPIEIHSAEFLFPKLPSTVRSLSMFRNQNRTVPKSGAVSPSLKYNFIHDLESLWWIIVWTLLLRVTDSEALDMVIFTADPTPHRDRRRFFIMGDSLAEYLGSVIHDSLCERLAHEYLAIYNHTIFTFYAKGKREDVTSYRNVYDTLWNETAIFIENMEGVDLELGYPSERIDLSSKADPQALGKRARSIDGNDGGAADRRGNVEGPSEQKKQKPGENRAEEVTVQDMAGIALEDSHPRIRGAWN
jgi:hypothetical protein